MPPFLHILRTCEANFREYLFQQLGVLVSVVKQHARPFLESVFSLVIEFWDSSMEIISLVEEISLALNDEFKDYIMEILPKMLAILYDDKSPKRGDINGEGLIIVFHKFGQI